MALEKEERTSAHPVRLGVIRFFLSFWEILQIYAVKNAQIKTGSAYHLYRKPGNSEENSNGIVHPGGSFSGKKSNTFRGINFLPVFSETTEIFCNICLVNQCQACSWGGRSFVLTQAYSSSLILQMVQL